MTTAWGERLDRASPLSMYPRPQLVRGDWDSLNGVWQYAILPLPAAAAASDPLLVADPTEPPAAWQGDIVVPFAPEAPLSGVARAVGADDVLWYRRSFRLPRPLAPDERVILHFGAVDQTCRVAVDGHEVGGHSGGYLGFSFDITAACAGAEGDEHDLVVAVRDVTDASWLARGKQSRHRGGLWYTAQSGIWQTVWLEIVPRVAVDGLVITPDLAGGAVEVTVRSDHATDDVADVEIAAAGEVIAVAEVPVGVPTRIPLPQPVQPWSPEDPFLYDVRVMLGDDDVAGYVGMRSFGVGRDDQGFPRFFLNGEPYFPVGLLDHGYWPDGGYTAPSDAALEFDILVAKRLGFTLLRKHIKVEPMRWYHHCDRLGMLVWQDAVNGGEGYPWLVARAPALTGGAPQFDDTKHARFRRTAPEGRARFEAELEEMIEQLRSVPSIMLWVPFNEGWGQFEARRIAERVRALDPTRLVDHASGWHDQGGGDVHSIHVYSRAIRVPRRRDDRVLAVSAFGGYSVRVAEHTWSERVFGYGAFRTAERLREALERVHALEIIPAIGQGLGATVYTQLTDVEDEVNGLVTYDRRVVKVQDAAMRAVNDAVRAAASAASRPVQ